MDKDVRIILASFNATWARRVFCQVSKINLYGARYQWILAGPRQERWWNETDPSVNCTVYEITAALEGAFIVDVLPLTSSKEKTISGLVSHNQIKYLFIIYGGIKKGERGCVRIFDLPHLCQNESLIGVYFWLVPGQ